jgi:predicted nucleic acid-binding protein
MDDIDPKDRIFIACALAIPDSVIWTDDKDFLKQKTIKIISQKEIIDLINGKI